MKVGGTRDQRLWGERGCIPVSFDFGNQTVGHGTWYLEDSEPGSGREVCVDLKIRGGVTGNLYDGYVLFIVLYNGRVRYQGHGVVYSRDLEVDLGV